MILDSFYRKLNTVSNSTALSCFFLLETRDLFWRTSSTEFCKALTDTADPVPKLYGAFLKNLLNF